jgi:hypothetical protein
MAVPTAALAAYILSRKLKFAGSPVTLARLAQMWQLDITAGQPEVGGAALEGVARFCKLTVDDLIAAVAAQTPLEQVIAKTEPITYPPEFVAPPPEPTLAAASASAPVVISVDAPMTPVIAKTDLATKFDNSDDLEVDISFEDVEPTPIPTDANDNVTTPPATSGKKKSKGKGKKKSG